MSPRKRSKGGAAASSSSKPQPDIISEDEQWRIINESKVLQRIPGAETVEEEDESVPHIMCEEIFNTTLFIIPFSFVLLLMDILAHNQYGRSATLEELTERMVFGVPVLSAFIFYTLRHKQDKRMQAALFLLSIVVGARMIYVVNRLPWLKVMQQTPPLGTIWIYTVVVLDLLPAVGALSIVAAWMWWKNLKIIF